uniref:Uncharacterized protein n=1 Tax=Romanomermis culicivorax TaxID=13658 RepID=A0A915L7G0_ROMCU
MASWAANASNLLGAVLNETKSQALTIASANLASNLPFSLFTKAAAFFKTPNAWIIGSCQEERFAKSECQYLKNCRCVAPERYRKQQKNRNRAYMYIDG